MADKFFSLSDGKQNGVNGSKNPLKVGKMSITTDYGNVYYDVEDGDTVKRILLGVGFRSNNNGEIFNDYENNKATGNYSHASGNNTIANYDNQFVTGKFNNNKKDTLFEIGNGNSDNRSNAMEIYLDGHAEIQTQGDTDNSVVIKKTLIEELKSENAQSGIAVAEAINSTKDDIYNNVSNSLKSTKSGAVITADDVSPLEHNLKVKLTSDTVTDFSGVSVIRKGINLFNPVENFDASNKDYVSLEDDVFTMSAPTAQVFINNAKTVVTPAGKYTITLFPLEDYSDFNAFIYFYNKDGGKTSISTGTIGVAFGTYSYTFTAYEDFILSIGGAYGHLYNGERKFRVMLEEGTVDNPKYSAFVEPQTVAANKYGTVKGLTSASPMTLYSDNDEVIIHCEYNRDINSLAPVLQRKVENWQPHTQYNDGDVVLFRALLGNTYILECKNNHTSPEFPMSSLEQIEKNWIATPIYAERAVQDEMGQSIIATYATKEELKNVGSGGSVDLTGVEMTEYKTNTIDENSTNDQYPSAKAVYTELQKKQNTLSESDFKTIAEAISKISSTLKAEVDGDIVYLTDSSNSVNIEIKDKVLYLSK